MSKEGLEVLARMTDSKIKLREVVDNWILLTYDIPHNEAGDKARQEFLERAQAVGAVRHTDSVYLMPASPAATKLALDLAKTDGGEVIVWDNAHPLNKNITESYDAALKPILKDISTRLEKMNIYQLASHQKRVLQMVPKTERLIQNMEAALERRGAEVLAVWLEILKSRFAQIMKR